VTCKEMADYWLNPQNKSNKSRAVPEKLRMSMKEAACAHSDEVSKGGSNKWLEFKE